MTKKTFKSFLAGLLTCIIVFTMLPADRVYAKEYDPAGVWVETEYVRTYSETGKVDLFRYGYDQYGRLSQEIRYYYGEFAFWDEYEYSDKGLMTKKIHYNEKGEMTGHDEFLYDPDYDRFTHGLRINVYNSSGKLTEYHVLNNNMMDCYDAQGKPIGAYSYNSPYIGSYFYTDKTEGTAVTVSYVDDVVTSYYVSEEDENGNTLKITYYNSDRTLDYWIEYKYIFDSNNNPVRKTAYRNGTEIIDAEEYKYEYDSNNNVIKVTTIVGGVESSFIIYEYDEAQNNTKKTYCSADGTVYSYDVLEYDTVGNVIRRTSYTPSGDIMSGMGYGYDKSGNLTKETVYDISGEKICDFEYDQDGEQLRYISYDNGKEILEYERIDKTIYYYNSDGSLWQTVELDDNGNTVRETSYSSGAVKSITEHKYVYLTYGTKVPIVPLSESEKEELKLNSLGYILNDKYVPYGYADRSNSLMYIEGFDCTWNVMNGKSYWYENNIKQGTYYDAYGVLGDNTIRGREIFDADSDGWYWLDSVYDGAKAEGKEVWIPYIYQDELQLNSDGMGRYANGISDDDKIRELALASNTEEAEMADQVEAAIRNHTGKWVRYDEHGRMLKGWVEIKGALAVCYPEQAGFTYYYDRKTGLMAKGWTRIEGVDYYFDEITGVLVP